jgi:hypothetical protein
VSRVTDLIYKAAFVTRWYFWYNLELTLLHASLPKDAPLWSPGSASEEAQALDQRRRDAQLAIFGIIRNYGSVCAACGACCKSKVDRFTAFDAAVRAAGPMPLRQYGRDIFSVPWMIVNGVQHTGERIAHALFKKPLPESELCENLGKKGCTLAHQDRPMLCASWFCPKYLRNMECEDLRKIAPKLREMERLHLQAARLIRKRNQEGKRQA